MLLPHLERASRRLTPYGGVLWVALLLGAAGLAATMATTAGAGDLARWQRAALALLVPVVAGAVSLLILRDWFAPAGHAPGASGHWRQGLAAFFVLLCLVAAFIIIGLLRLLAGA
jgi:hypothetical protein